MGSITSPIAYVANQGLREPCRRAGTSITCALWLALPHGLRAGGVTAVWSETSFFGASFARSPGKAAVFDGRRARITRYVDRTCKGLNATAAYVARIDNGRHGWWELYVCLRGPETRENIRRVERMLTSATFG